MEAARASSRCEISQVGKSRNGQPRWWCRTHGAPATGRNGARLFECESAQLDVSKLKTLRLSPKDFPGGIGIWGAVDPIFNTSGRLDRPGVHVHARHEPNGAKVIDETYDTVSLLDQFDLFGSRSITLTHEAAVSYYVSDFLGVPIKHLFCRKCGEPHLDAGHFATHPHRRHLCNACGTYFLDTEKGVSNPIVHFRKLSPSFATTREIQRSAKTLFVSQADFPGGFQIWASNPALIWTAERHEEEGIHVHAFDSDTGWPAIDDTFGCVVIDGINLNVRQVAQLMAQRTLPYLSNRVVSIHCPVCGEAHFDEGRWGVTPHKNHCCSACGSIFQHTDRRKLVVSNPILDQLDTLTRNRPTVIR